MLLSHLKLSKPCTFDLKIPITHRVGCFKDNSGKEWEKL